jgi:hypothetical protein
MEPFDVVETEFCTVGQHWTLSVDDRGVCGACRDLVWRLRRSLHDLKKKETK